MAAQPLKLSTTAQVTLMKLLLAIPSSPSTPPTPGTQPVAAALVGGVADTSGNILIPGLDAIAAGAWEQLTTAQQQTAINGLCQALAAFMVETGLGGGGLTQSVQVVVDVGGDTNTLHFTNGLLTSVTIP